MAKAVRKFSRTAELADEYGRRITSGTLKPGESLPVEASLAAQWRVSRTVVREAVRHLAAKGLLTVGPKVGTRVLPVHEWNMLDADVMAWHLMARERRDFVEALYEMRLINEPAAARQAAARIGASDRVRLSEALERMSRFPRGSHELIEADLDLHRIILEATGNPLLRSLGAMIDKSLSISFSLSWRRNPQEETVRQHTRVVDAVLSGDGDAAELFMRRLIESAFDDVMTELYAQGESGVGGKGAKEGDAASPEEVAAA